MYKKSVFIFRRDFRLYDNNGLLNILKKSDKIIPIFIMTPEQLVNNKYKSSNTVQFMFECLEDLDKQLKSKNGKLYYFYGEPNNVLQKIIKEQNIDCIAFNLDYSPYSKKRDLDIQKLCEKNNIDCIVTEDILLNSIGSIKTGSGDIYTKFTPYFNNAKQNEITRPQSNKFSKYFKGKIENEYKGDVKKYYEENDKLLLNGGRDNAIKRLNKLYLQKDYNKSRNCLTEETTYLSAYIKYGCLSIREVYWKFRDELGTKTDLIKQLYWRDFYYNILWRYPQVLKGSLKEKYDKIKWENNMTWFKKWTEGKTGYPIVDAGIREMNETGFMHNRSRLITSNFLIKLLLIDWRKGEWYFATQLYDYDVANNNGNWQWSSSSGADSQPYFRIFNPWLQSKKFDPDGKYIKKWCPELKDVAANDLHKWDKTYEKYKVDYPKPIIEYEKQRKLALQMYKKYI